MQNMARFNYLYDILPHRVARLTDRPSAKRTNAAVTPEMEELKNLPDESGLPVSLDSLSLLLSIGLFSSSVWRSEDPVVVWGEFLGIGDAGKTFL